MEVSENIPSEGSQGSRTLRGSPFQRVPESLGLKHPHPADSSPCSQPRTNIHGQVHPEVHVLGPGLLHWVLTHHREDAPVQVGLASRLVIPGHSNDRGTGAVPGHLVSRPEKG